MTSKPRRAPQKGYTLQKVTVRELFASGETREPSEKALRARAQGRDPILVFVESIGNAHYYDRQLSTIRVNAARACKRPGVQWKDIEGALRQTPLTNDRLIGGLKDGQSMEAMTNLLTEELLRAVQP